MFLRNSGIVPRRTLAQKACSGGLVKVDGRTVKPASPVEVGQEIALQLGMSRKRYRVLQLPNRPVAKAARVEYAELIESEGIG